MGAAPSPRSAARMQISGPAAPRSAPARRRSDRLPEGAVPGIPRPVSRRVAFHITKVIVHFRAQRPLDNPGRQLADQPARAVQQRNRSRRRCQGRTALQVITNTSGAGRQGSPVNSIAAGSGRHRYVPDQQTTVGPRGDGLGPVERKVPSVPRMSNQSRGARRDRHPTHVPGSRDEPPAKAASRSGHGG